MRVVTAPESIEINGEVSVMLCGGITACENWQQEVIALLSPYDGILFNPRRENFPIHDLKAARAQITWEFNALKKAEVFSMWFCASKESDQPICLYELGRHLAIRKAQNDLECVVIGIEPGYRREQDVRIQTELVNSFLASRISNNLADHAQNIRQAVLTARAKL